MHDRPSRQNKLSLTKMPSHANAFEISDIEEERNREPVLTSDQSWEWSRHSVSRRHGGFQNPAKGFLNPKWPPSRLYGRLIQPPPQRDALSMADV
jgi:hypothetical protein